MTDATAFAMRADIQRAIDGGRYDDALTLIRRSVEAVIDEPLCAGHVFGDKSLDDFCQVIGAKVGRDAPAKAAQPVTVYLASKLQKSGGHTRVLIDLIQAAPASSQHIILCTEIDGASDRAAVALRVKNNNVLFEWCDAPTLLGKLEWLQKRLAEIAPETVWLFNHHQDSAIIAAVQPKHGYETYFYHHGDHHLTLGLYLDFAQHIDPHPMGYYNCRDKLGIRNVFCLPLWISDKASGGDRLFMPNGVMTTATIANANKVEVPYIVDYINMVPRLLAVTKGVHVHIGKLTPWGLFRLRRGLRRAGIDPSRFMYMPNVTDVARELVANRVDLYIASFPYGGARTLIEVMSAGIPVVVHDHYATRLLGGMDLAYPTAFTWRTPDELFAHMRGVTPELLQREGTEARAHFLTFHDAKNFVPFTVERLAAIPAPPPLRPHRPDALERAFDTARQMSVLGVLWRFMYRNRRKLRRFTEWRSK